jgi:Putative phage abortive infection protein
MEIFLLSFSLGVALTMVLVALRGKISNIGLALLLVVFVFVLWYEWATRGAIYFLRYLQDAEKQRSPEQAAADGGALLQALGQTGDLFGGVNALFAALAFAGVAVAAVIQSRTLQIAIKQQQQQSFEPLFFHLLQLNREVSAPRFPLSGRIDKKSRSFEGPNGIEASVAFSRAMTLLRRALRMKSIGLLPDPNGKSRLKLTCSMLYIGFYESNQDELGPHFRSLYQVFKLIDTSVFDEDTKVKYANIARSTLGKDQLFLLAVNCTSPYGLEFQPLVEKYGLLRHIARDAEKLTIDEKVADWCYRRTATLGADDRKIFGRSS